MLTAGLAKICITPPLGVPLAGFAARQGNASGVHDDLYVRACVIEDDGRALAFVTVDLLALDARFMCDVRRVVHRRTGITPESVLIAATHTHAGPVTIQTFFNPGASLDAGYMGALATAIEHCVTEAWDSRQPARIGVGTGRAEGVASTVERLTGSRSTIRSPSQSGRRRGSHARRARQLCVPSDRARSRQSPGDRRFPFLHYRRDRTCARAGGVALFINGTQGNISVGHSSELSAIGIITPGRTFERAAAIGSALGRAALEALPQVRTASRVKLNSISTSAELPLKSYAGAAETAAAVDAARKRLDDLVDRAARADDIARARTERLYASITEFFAAQARTRSNGHLPIELQAFRIGDTAFVAVPAEVFVEIGLRIKGEAAHQTFICGVTNGYIGYLPDKSAYAAGGYEVVASMCAEGADDALVRATHVAVERLFA